MKIYLNSFRPLTRTAAGRAAVQGYGIRPFVDGSCRREPDLESDFPSITALCRFRSFAPRLQENEIAVYLTVQASLSRPSSAALAARRDPPGGQAL